MNSMRGKISVWLLAAALLTTAPLAQGQQPTSRPRIGYLSGVSPSAETARREAFSRGLRELGYVEGKTIIIEASLFRGKLQPAGRARDRAGAPKAGPDRYRR